MHLFHLNDTPHINNNANTEIGEISEWFKINKLSLNANKTKFMLFRMPQKSIQNPIISINNITI